MTLSKLSLVLVCLFLPFQALAQTKASPKFAFPLDCALGKDCWTLNYTDTTADGDGKSVDPGCLNRTYDGHTGTDFIIPDERAMKDGVDVLAARGGRVIDVRDGIPDQWLNTAQLAEIKKTTSACGNRVFIDHGNGWITKYCHLKRGSLDVRENQNVRVGERLGEVGLSGYTQLPHLHFEIEYKGKTIDPYTGAPISQNCGTAAASMWEDPAKMRYEPLSITRSGFDMKEPSVGLLDRGVKTAEFFYANSVPELFYFVLFNGARKNDKIVLSVTGPDGKEFMKRDIVQDRNLARQFYFIGRKTDKVLLRKGIYKASTLITRIYGDGTKQHWSETASVEIK